MFNSVSQWWGWLVSDGALLLAVGIGILISLGVTQAVKLWFGCGRVTTRAIAFVIGTTAAFQSAPQKTWVAFWLSVTAGLLAPTLYKGFVEFARWRGWEWVDHLSGDKT